MYAIAAKKLRPPGGSAMFRHRAFRSLPSSTFDSSRLASPRSISHTSPRFYDIEYDGVSDNVSKIINKHAHRNQTSVSLQALMRTGRGEFLHKHFDEEKIDDRMATELVLIQVGVSYDKSVVF